MYVPTLLSILIFIPATYLESRYRIWIALDTVIKLAYLVSENRADTLYPICFEKKKKKTKKLRPSSTLGKRK